MSHFYLKSCLVTKKGGSVKGVVIFKSLIKQKYCCPYREPQNHLDANRGCINSTINVTPRYAEGIPLTRAMANGFSLT